MWGHPKVPWSRTGAGHGTNSHPLPEVHETQQTHLTAPQWGLLHPPSRLGVQRGIPPTPKTLPGYLHGAEGPAAAAVEAECAGGAAATPPPAPGQSRCQRSRLAKSWRGGAQPDGGGVSLGHPSPCWGSFIMEEPLMEGKFFPPQGTQSPPYPLPRELGGLNFPPQGD